MNAHTQGPWVAKQRYGAKANEGWVLLWPDKGGTHMRRLDSPEGFHKTDALVLAAGPDLLAGLQEALEIIKCFHGPAQWETYRDHSPEMKRLRAAISSATGRPA